MTCVVINGVLAGIHFIYRSSMTDIRVSPSTGDKSTCHIQLNQIVHLEANLLATSLGIYHSSSNIVDIVVSASIGDTCIRVFPYISEIHVISSSTR